MILFHNYLNKDLYKIQKMRYYITERSFGNITDEV